jgi:hypothetical protein
MSSSAGGSSLALHTDRRESSDDRPSCLENPRPEGVESTLTENAASPFQAEPAQSMYAEFSMKPINTAVPPGRNSLVAFSGNPRYGTATERLPSVAVRKASNTGKITGWYRKLF